MRLIDKDALMKKLGIAYSCSFCEGNMDGIKCARYTEFVSACKAICEAPEIEPKTGEWHGTVCSACGESTPFYFDCKYCPNCGCKMEVDG